MELTFWNNQLTSFLYCSSCGLLLHLYLQGAFCVSESASKIETGIYVVFSILLPAFEESLQTEASPIVRNRYSQDGYRALPLWIWSLQISPCGRSQIRLLFPAQHAAGFVYKYWTHEPWSFPACGQARTARFGLSKTSQRSTRLTLPLPRLQPCYCFRCYLEREVFIDFLVFSSLTPTSWLTLPWHLQQHSSFITYTRFKSFHSLCAFHPQLPHHSTRGWQRQSLVCRETISTGSRGALIFLIWHFTDIAG